jgi:hypothetical protein
LVEQLIRNQQVVSSSLTVGSSIKRKFVHRPRGLSTEAIFFWAARAKNWGLSTFFSGEEAPIVAQVNRESDYSTVTVKVALDFTDPDAPASPGAGVAVMVAVDVTGLVVELLVVPPQPETKPRPAKRTTSNTSM